MDKPLPFYLSKRGLLSALIAAIFTPHAYAAAMAAAAGKVDFAFGKVIATGTDGATRVLTKGAQVFSGDAIKTGSGRAQIRFIDGAYMALQPNTEFKIDKYVFDGKQDGTERSDFSLVKGSLRTISGLIGHLNKQNYEVRTPTATIGIRGTEYAANQTDHGLLVTCGRGLVAVSNDSGHLLIGTGQSAFVHTLHSPPQMTDQRAALVQQLEARQVQQAVQQQSEQQPVMENVAAAGEQRTASGASAALPGGTYAVAWGYGHGSTAGIAMQSGANASFNSDGAVTAFSGTSGSADFSSAQLAESPEWGWDSVIGWGRWSGPVNGTAAGAGTNYGEGEGFAYVVGIPSTIASLNLGSGAIVEYGMLGATSPVTTSGGSSSLGTFEGTAEVQFNAIPTMALNATVETSAANYNLGNIGAMNLHFNGGSATFTTGGTVTGASSTSATVNINGFFAGSGGERLGIAYEINAGSSQTTGAAAFTKSPSPP